MKRFLVVFLAFVALTASAQSDVYGFKVADENNKEVSLGQWKGKVLLIVNTAINLDSRHLAVRQRYISSARRILMFIFLSLPRLR